MTETRLLNRQTHVADLTVAEAVDWCVERNLRPDAVRITGTHLKWQTPETAEERERREGFQRERDERTEKWEREAPARFIEKYGVPS